MDTSKSGQTNWLLKTGQMFIAQVSSSNRWPYYLTGVIVLLSEIVTALMNSINSMIWWGRIDADLLIIGCIDALVASLIAAPIGIYFIQRASEIHIVNRNLRLEVDAHRQAENLLKKQAEELIALNALGRTLSATITLEHLCSTTVKVLYDAIHPDQTFLFLCHGERLVLQDMEPRSRDHISASVEHKAGECLCGLAAKEGMPVFSVDIFADHRCIRKECKNAGFRSFAAVPILINEETIGVIGMASESIRDFEKRAAFLEILSNQVAVSINNTRLFEALQQELADRKLAQEALVESEKKYRIITENSADIISIIDKHLKFKYISPAVRRLLGLTVEETLAKAMDQILTPGSMKTALDAFENEMALETGGTADPDRTRTLELEGYKKDGSTVWMEVGLSYLRNRGSDTVEFLAVSRDISERKRAEAALKESEKSFSQLFESAPIPVAFASEVDKFRATTWNEAWHLTFGYSREAANGRSGNDIGLWVHPEDRHRFIDLATRQNYVTDFQAVMRRQDGTVRYCSLFGRFIDKSGHRLLMVLYLDITDRKHAEEALQESEEKFRLTFSSSPDSVTISHLKDGRYLDVNEGFIKATGFSREEATGKTSVELNLWHDAADRTKMIDGLLENGIVENLEVQFRRKNGSLINALLSARIILLNGVQHIITIIRDISEIKALTAKMQQVQRFEAIGSLAGGIAHDFNNLLMGIQGRVSLMTMGIQDSDPNLEHLGAIDEYIKSATNLTKQLLGIARGGKYEVASVDINELVLGSSAMFGRTRKEILIHTKCPERQMVVEADRGQLEQVLLNLYINAWQAMPPIGGDLYIETNAIVLNAAFCISHQIKPGTYVEISVTDTGSGMDEATRRQVFDPFFTTKEKGRGTGLGLASAYGIIKNHGGAITVYSEIGHGTTFHIYLPQSHNQAKTEELPRQEIIRGTETILLVDDEELIIDVGQAMLENLGYRVVIGKNGQEAIDRISEPGNQIELVILDMIMPGMDGGNCFDGISSIRPDIPVILSSGYSANSQAEKILNKGCAGFIQKPYTISDLSTKVRQVLDASKE